MSGYLRGVDFYSRWHFVKAFARAYSDFVRHHGYFPSISKPQGFDEKILFAKFFVPMKVPESGNKLLTSHFIPEDLRGDISCPKIIWHSKECRLPSNDEIAPGRYFLKASHGSSMFEPISYPLDDAERRRLEDLGQTWLSNRYGFKHGEWWYNAFESEVLIEERVGESSVTVAWDVRVFSGKVAGMSVFKKYYDKGQWWNESLWLGADFRPLPFQHPTRRLIENPNLREQTKERLTFFASRIGAAFPFVRVDFLLDENERIYLGELTFSPSNGNSDWPREYDLYLGSLWTL